MSRPHTGNGDSAEPENSAELFLRRRKNQVAEQTIWNNRGHLKSFTDWCADRGVVDLAQLDGGDFLEYQFYLEDERNLKPITVGNHFNTLRTFFKFLEKYDYIPQEGHVATQLESPEFGKGDEVRHTMLQPEAANEILDYLDTFEYGTRDHVLFALLWHTGARVGAVRGLDLGDYTSIEETPSGEPYGTLEFHHRPDEGTPLKNGDDGTAHQDGGEREIFIEGAYCEVIDDYIRINRRDKKDQYGRKPLLTTRNGRPAINTLRMKVYRLTRPCVYAGTCPIGKDPDTCDYATYKNASKCPESVSPHPLRRSAITRFLREKGMSYEDSSERFNVSVETLKKHYDETRKEDRRRNRAERYFQNKNRHNTHRP